MAKMKRKLIDNFVIASIVLMGFYLGIYYSTVKFENQVQVWDSNYQIITDKVYAFEKVSDPETIRLYVKELNKLLDDIRFLGYIVDSGQLADGAMTGYFEKYNAKLDEVNDMIFGLHEELTVSIEQLHGKDKGLYDDIKINLELVESLQTRLSRAYKSMDTRFTTIVEDIDSLTAKLDAAEETFFGKYIFVE
jgi:hypothetical protein